MDGILKVCWIHHIILDQMKSFLWKLDIGFWIYGLVNHLGPNCPKLFFLASEPKVKVYFNTWWSGLKITAVQWSSTIATSFVTAEKLCRMVKMTANTKMGQQLLTTIAIFATSFKIIFAILCQRQVKQTKSMTEGCTAN